MQAHFPPLWDAKIIGNGGVRPGISGRRRHRAVFERDRIGPAGQDNISVTKCKNIVSPLPPLSEQKRIVSKVTHLLSQVTRLESTLTRRESTRTGLLTAAIHALLNNQGPAEPAA